MSGLCLLGQQHGSRRRVSCVLAEAQRCRDRGSGAALQEVPSLPRQKGYPAAGRPARLKCLCSSAQVPVPSEKSSLSRETEGRKKRSHRLPSEQQPRCQQEADSIQVGAYISTVTVCAGWDFGVGCVSKMGCRSSRKPLLWRVRALCYCGTWSKGAPAAESGWQAHPTGLMWSLPGSRVFSTSPQVQLPLQATHFLYLLTRKIRGLSLK